DLGVGTGMARGTPSGMALSDELRYAVLGDEARGSRDKNCRAHASPPACRRSARRLSFLLLLPCGDAGLVALGLCAGAAVDGLDHSPWRTIAEAESGLEHTSVAAVPLLVAGGENVEQLLDHLLVPQPGRGQP